MGLPITGFGAQTIFQQLNISSVLLLAHTSFVHSHWHKSFLFLLSDSAFAKSTH